MGWGQANISELKDRAVARADKSVRHILTSEGLHEQMNPRNMKVRECIACDDHPNPLPIALVLDTTGSMERVPERLLKHDLPNLLTCLERTGATKGYMPQVCFCGVADTGDFAPFQFGQFEADNRMDDWLQKISLGGGGGSERMHEAYHLPLYALARKTKCDIWKTGGKGYAMIAGDELCPDVLSRHAIEGVFGDRVPHDIKTKDLIAEVQEKFNLYFLCVATGFYGPQTIDVIFAGWKHLLGNRAIKLDRNATALPEIMTALIGINEGVFTAEEVPVDLRELGCDAAIVNATAAALGVNPGQSRGDTPDGNKRRRGPKPL